MNFIGKSSIKDILGSIPYAADVYWRIRGNQLSARSRFSLEYLKQALPQLNREIEPYLGSAEPGKRIFLFANLHYWIEHAALLGYALAGLGHKISLGYVAYSDWQNPVHPLDMRRQQLYAKDVLLAAKNVFQPVAMHDIPVDKDAYPRALEEIVHEVSIYDSQYTLQVEDINQEDPVYQMRLQRNRMIAGATYSWLKRFPQDLVIVPNGTIQELGVVYRVARLLKTQAITYEFGEQRDRIWLAQNSEIMQQDTDDLWESRKSRKINPEQRKRIEKLYRAREGGQRWENFSRLWQGSSLVGGDKIRGLLGLDERPVVLISTNVIGDSLTLGRQKFTSGMTEWLTKSLEYLSSHANAQVVIRVHPGEILTRGTSVVDIVNRILPERPPHIHLIGPREKINTYDLMQITNLGMVYTTTVGMEMAMRGIPVLVTGMTHYRGRGFTYDPDSWDEFFKLLNAILRNQEKYRLDPEKIDLAWRYAYYFFFDFPRPFPWHLVKVWDDYRQKPLPLVLGDEGRLAYGQTFRYLTGEMLDWDKIS